MTAWKIVIPSVGKI